MSQTKKAQSPRFAVGDAVRVRFGVTDPDSPDMPLGGWAGRVTQIEERNSLYLVRWSQVTLKQVHPIYRNRCERDGLDLEEMWLGAEDLECDTGGPVILETPTKIVTPPLSMKDQDDRIRAVFNLTRDDLPPGVDEASLRQYFRFLAANLTFPFEATWSRETGFSQMTEKVTVHALGDFEGYPWIDETYGIVCKSKMSGGEDELPLAEMGNVKGKTNKQLVEDYAYWFWNHP